MAKPTRLTKELPLVVPALNLRTDRSRLRPGELSECMGVDGRFIGALRKFPGFTRFKNLDDIDATTSITDMHYVTLQKGTTDYTLRGFLVLRVDASDSKHKLTFFYYDDDGGVAVWNDHDVCDGDGSPITVTAASKVSVAGSARYCYIAVDGQAPQVLWATGTAGNAATVNQDAMGPGTGAAGASNGPYDTDEDGDVLKVPACDDVENASGHLSAGVYHVMYRFYDSDRDIYSGRSAILEQTIAGDDKYIEITNPDADPDRAYDAGYDEVHVFRSMSASVGGSAYTAGLFYHESTYDLDSGADCWPASVTVGETADELLVFEDVFDPMMDIPGTPPSSGTVAYMDGVTFMGGDRTGSAVTKMRWSQLGRLSPEVFPTTDHEFRWDIEDGHLIRFVHAGDMLYAFTENAAYRVAKSGGQLVIGRMHGGRSVVGRRAAATLGRDIIGVTPLGVAIFDGMDGTMSMVGALDRLIMEEWVSDWANVFVVNDGTLGCTFIVNSAQQEAAVVWHVTGAITRLADCDWVAGCEGPDPTGGGRSRSFFVTSSGLVVTPDEDRSETFTMHGLDTSYTLDSTATAGGGVSNLLDSGATFHADMVGAKVYIFETDGSYSSTVISAVAFGALTLTDAQSEAPDGKRYSVDPVVFRVRAWPISAAGAPPVFGRRKAMGMGVFSAGHVGVAGNDNGYWRMGLCRNFEDVPGNALAVVAMDERPSEQWVAVSLDGAALEPWVEQIGSKIDFRLLAIGVDVTMDTSRHTE